MAVITDNFLSIIENADLRSTDMEDRRFCIYARNAVFDVEAYLGYLRYAEKFAMAARVSVPMLELGFIPIIMPPSFWGRQVHDIILPLLPKELPYFFVKTTNFTNWAYDGGYDDVWVSKMDAAKLLGIAPEYVTSEEVIRYALR